MVYLCQTKLMRSVRLITFLAKEVMFSVAFTGLFVCLYCCLFVCNIPQKVKNGLQEHFTEQFGVVKGISAYILVAFKENHAYCKIRNSAVIQRIISRC